MQRVVLFAIDILFFKEIDVSDVQIIRYLNNKRFIMEVVFVIMKMDSSPPMTPAFLK